MAETVAQLSKRVYELERLMAQATEERTEILKRLPTKEQINTFMEVVKEREYRDARAEEWDHRRTAFIRWGAAIFVLLQAGEVMAELWLILHK